MMYAVVEVPLHTFLDFALNKDNVSVLRPGRFTLRERDLGNQCTGRWKNRSAHCEEGKALLDMQGVEFQFLGRPARNLVATSRKLISFYARHSDSIL
jgi:hypothetical protein